MGLTVAGSNATIASGLKDTLILASIRASEWSTKKATAAYAASQGDSIRKSKETDDRAHVCTMYGHYIRCLPREVLVRILEQTLASIQGVKVAKKATDSPHYTVNSNMQRHFFRFQGDFGIIQSIPNCVFLTFCGKFDCHSVMRNI